MTIPEPVTKVHFKVSSEVPPTRVDLVRGDKIVKRWETIPPVTEGIYEFSVSDVVLDWGLNALEILVRNEGGVGAKTLNINVPPQPVRLELDHVEVAPAGLKFSQLPDGSFSPLPVGREPSSVP